MANHKSALGAWVLKKEISWPSTSKTYAIEWYTIECKMPTLVLFAEGYRSDRGPLYGYASHPQTGAGIGALVIYASNSEGDTPVGSTSGYIYVDLTSIGGTHKYQSVDNEDFRTIYIASGADAENTDLIEWLEANTDVQPELTYSFRHYYQNSTLIGDTSTKFRCFSVEEPAEVENCITFTGEEGDFTLIGEEDWDGVVEYSTDATSWTEWDGTEISSSNNKLYLRGSGNTTFYTSNSGVCLELSAKAKCTGNIQTLLQYDNPPTTVSKDCYRSLFQDCTNLTYAPELPATTLGDRCYLEMFYGCASLTQAPELPATTLAERCYGSMFSGCTNLTQPPELPAMTLATGCYSSMFSGCTNLTQVPELPSMTLAKECYSSMFSRCTNLTQVPELPATTLAVNCYSGMFQSCTNLTQPPELPATTLADSCYSLMFYNCTNLTQPPELPATTLADSCYSFMFQSCTNLTQPPELPAATLADNCYNYMFQSCTNLTQPPELPATTLADGCYSSMFRDCKGLALSETRTDEYTGTYRIPSEGTGVIGTNSLLNMFVNTAGTFTGTPEINTTYYLRSVAS